ncbi:hypothetical protein [Sphingomonas sp. S2M10]|uniref:hypothetical protein n=1 Tax=Sphingomonas sp. S2M10 TaxID=2705010 RepID=UPI001B3B209D|nr:hypothetical protein [Sphingomonas sp. S2M10]
MMSRFRSAPLRFDRQSRLPLLLTLPLAAALAFQLAVPADDDLPPAGPLPGGRRADGTVLPAPAVPPIGMAARSGLFTPPPPVPAGGTAVAGPVVLGSIAVRGARAALVQGANGRIARVAPGRMVAGWRLVAIEANAVRLARGTDKAIVPFGGRVTPPPAGTTGEPQ